MLGYKLNDEAIRRHGSILDGRRWTWYRCKPLALAGVAAWFGICYWIGCLWFSR